MNRTTKDDSFLVADGIKSTMTMPTKATGTANQSLQENSLKGYSGSCPFPARLDHSHPLNVRSTGDFTGGHNLNNEVKPVGTTGQLGTSKYYARLDHVHALSTGNNKYKTWDSSFGYNEIGSYKGSIQLWNRGDKSDDGSSFIGCNQLLCLSSTTSIMNGTYCIMRFRPLTIDENGTIKSVGQESLSIRVAHVIGG